MDERTTRVIAGLGTMASNLELVNFHTAARECRDAMDELQRLSALVDAAPDWMERPTGPGLWMYDASSEIPFNSGECKKYCVLNLVDDEAVNLLSRCATSWCGPIPKGTDDDNTK